MVKTSGCYYVYLLSNPSHSVVYVGMTGDLECRVAEHQAHAIPGFTARYNAVELVYYETCTRVEDALAREKQLKAGRAPKRTPSSSKTTPTGGIRQQTFKTNER